MIEMTLEIADGAARAALAKAAGMGVGMTVCVPIIVNGRVIGAIGCGGGSPDEDHECASAGAAALAA
jgi:uncharacterized protein GlcG (DUF336 family)